METDRILRKWKPICDSIRRHNDYIFDDLELAKYCEELLFMEPEPWTTIGVDGMGTLKPLPQKDFSTKERKVLKNSIVDFVFVYVKYGVKVNNEIVKKYKEKIDSLPDKKLFDENLSEELRRFIFHLIRKEKLKKLNEE